MNMSEWSYSRVLWILFATYNCVLFGASNERTSAWTKDTRQSTSVVCTKDAIASTHASSVTQCGNHCIMQNGCTAYSYVKDMVPACYMMASAPISITGCDAAINAKHFMKVENSSTCPADDGMYHTYLLVDGSLFTYRIVHASVDATAANNDCVSYGGHLAKLSSVAKLSQIQYILNTCADFSQTYYWIDGRNDYFDTYGVWKWADGETMNMNSSFWNPGFPDQPSYQHCLLLDRNNGYKFNDAICAKMLINFICEHA